MTRTKQTTAPIVGTLMPRDDNKQHVARSNDAFVANMGKGRRPGAVNKTTRKVRETVLDTFEKIGGGERFVAWAKKNEGTFYKYFMRLLPVEDRAPKTAVNIVLLRGDDKI